MKPVPHGRGEYSRRAENEALSAWQRRYHVFALLWELSSIGLHFLNLFERFHLHPWNLRKVVAALTLYKGLLKGTVVYIPALFEFV